MLSALLTGVALCRSKPEKGRQAVLPAIRREPSFSTALVTSVRSALTAILNVCAFVVLFYVLARPLAALPGLLAPGLTGGLELFSATPMVTQLGEQTGIPVVTLDSGLTATPDAYRLLGKILGAEDRGNELADYAQKTLDNISSMVSKVPDSDKVTVYYAESADGLKTDGTDSMPACCPTFSARSRARSASAKAAWVSERSSD